MTIPSRRFPRLAGPASALVLLAACSKAPPVELAAPLVCTIAEGQPTPAAGQAAREMQKQIQASPLYQAALKASTLQACSWRFPEGSALGQDYIFGNGARLKVKRDAAIEYNEQSLSLAEPAAQPMMALLQQAERASFGEQGCGIDWKADPEQAAPTASAEAGTASELVYRGEACNCQARVRKNAQGGAIGLQLRSAC